MRFGGLGIDDCHDDLEVWDSRLSFSYKDLKPDKYQYDFLVFNILDTTD